MSVYQLFTSKESHGRAEIPGSYPDPLPDTGPYLFRQRLVEGGVNRAERVGEELAGKGINVSRGLQLVNMAAPGVIPIGNATQEY